MERKKISFAGPWITQKEIDYVNEAVRHGWYKTFDMHIRRLEKAVCDYVGMKHAVATHCCTLALHLACKALDLKEGDEVICTDFSWVATAHAILYTGAKPVFVDIEPDSWCISPSAIEEAVTPRTKAIMLVHTFGCPAQMDEIMAVAKKHGLAVIEDAAPALGATFKGQKVGSFGDFGCFSFHGAKVAVSGEGGIILMNSKEMYHKVERLANMGRTDSQAVFWSDFLGYQYTIGNLPAAVALAQVERIEELVARKRQIFGWYDERLSRVEGLTLIREKKDCRSNYCYPSLLVDESVAVPRDKIVRDLKELNIHCRPTFPQMSRFPMYEQRYPNLVSDRVARQGISLASAADITEEDVDFVCRSLRTITGR
jgi:perosamine synthetase